MTTMPMTTMATTTIPHHHTGSFNRQKDWKKCCAVAMGFEWVDEFNDDQNENTTSTKHDGVHHEEEKTTTQKKKNIDMMMMIGGVGGPILQITNLLDGSEFENPLVISDNNNDNTKIMTNVVARLNNNNEEMKKQQEETSGGGGEDHWNENAFRIQADLTRMSKWIRNKSQDYISLEMKDDEASLIQSTVTSFAATTASELDTLRKIIPAETSSSDNSNSNNNNNDVANHRSGIVQILLSQLQEQITQPFGILQKQRTRVAVSIWQNPIQCKLYQPKINNNNKNDNDVGGSNARIEEQRFIPQQPLIPSSYEDDDEHHDFILQYYDTIEEEEGQGPPVRPAFLLRFEQNNDTINQQQLYEEKTDDDNFSYSDDDDKEKGENPSTDFDQLKAIQQQQKQQQQHREQQQQQHIPNYYDQQQQQENDILQEEARLLTQAIRHNDLDSVQKMEQRMVEITTLISQFANLVSQQQEDVIQIHEASKDAKQNIDKGKENLIDATERTKQSKHYMAYSILIMSVILIFFDLLRN